MKADAAKALAREIVESGEVEFSRHALKEMDKDDLQTTDCLNPNSGWRLRTSRDGEERIEIPGVNPTDERDNRVLLGEGVARNNGMEEPTMKCDECDEPMTVERNAVRKYVIGGLPHVELHGVKVTRCDKCEREDISIPRIAELHRVLAEVFIKQPRMLAPVEIRFLRKHIGFSTGDFAAIMGVARESVSRWETGKNPMGATADRLLRLIVANHQPTQTYAVEDLLRSLNDRPWPQQLRPVSVSNRPVTGWTESDRSSGNEHRTMAMAQD